LEEALRVSALFLVLARSWFLLASRSFRYWLSVTPPKGDFVLADNEVTVVNYFGGDIDAVLKLEIDEVWLSVLDLIQRGLLACRGLDVGKCVVVIDR